MVYNMVYSLRQLLLFLFTVIQQMQYWMNPLTGCQSSCKHSPFVNVQIYICDIYFTDPFPVAQTADVTVIRRSKCMNYMGGVHLSYTRKLLCVKDTSDPAGDDLDFVSKNNY